MRETQLTRLINKQNRTNVLVHISQAWLNPGVNRVPLRVFWFYVVLFSEGWQDAVFKEYITF